MSYKTYIAYCPNCKKQTPSYIKRQPTIRKGVLLMCSRCGHDHKRRINLNRLIEYQPITQTAEESSPQTLPIDFTNKIIDTSTKFQEVNDGKRK